MSQAASFCSTTIQLSLNMGVGIAAQLLHLSMAGRDGTMIQAGDFRMAFACFGTCTVLPAFLDLRRAVTAGNIVSGYPGESGSQGSQEARKRGSERSQNFQSVSRAGLILNPAPAS